MRNPKRFETFEFRISYLFLISILVFSILTLIPSASLAMGGPAPKKEAPKYELKILKMEVVYAPTTPEASTLKKTLKK